MATVTQAEVNVIFDEHIAKFPSLTDTINSLKTLYSQKMWHQVTDLLLEYV
jgi:hypothetical protein